MKISLNIFTQYRQEAMGVATILILLCHSLLPPSIYCPNPLLRWVIVMGNRGVDIFLFLFGLGMYHSLRNLMSQKEILWRSIGKWYAKHYWRILFPYLLFGIPYWVVYLLQNGDLSVSSFLYYGSTLGYWTEHKGFWYMALLIPLYLLMPWYVRVMERISYRGILTIVLCVLSVWLGTLDLSGVCTAEQAAIWNNIAFVIQRLPSFFIGYGIAPMILSGKNINIYVALLGVIGVFAIIKLCFPAGTYWEWLAIYPILVVAVYAFRCKPLRRMCTFMGKISWESYLANVSMMLFIGCLPWEHIPTLNYGNYLRYAIVVVGSIVAAWVVHRIWCNIILAKR